MFFSHTWLIIVNRTRLVSNKWIVVDSDLNQMCSVAADQWSSGIGPILCTRLTTRQSDWGQDSNFDASDPLSCLVIVCDPTFFRRCSSLSRTWSIFTEVLFNFGYRFYFTQCCSSQAFIYIHVYLFIFPWPLDLMFCSFWENLLHFSKLKETHQISVVSHVLRCSPLCDAVPLRVPSCHRGVSACLRCTWQELSLHPCFSFLCSCFVTVSIVQSTLNDTESKCPADHQLSPFFISWFFSEL